MGASISGASVLLAVFVSTLAGTVASAAPVLVLISMGAAATLVTRGKEIVDNLQESRCLEAYSQPGNLQQAGQANNREALRDKAANASMMPAATREFSSADQVFDAVHNLDDWRHLPHLLEQSSHLEVFRHAAMLNDLLFFSIVFCHLPGGDFVRHMKQRSKATDMTSVECCDFMFPELASRIKRHLKHQQQIMSPYRVHTWATAHPPRRSSNSSATNK